jgi:hypothetical protein
MQRKKQCFYFTFKEFILTGQAKVFSRKLATLFLTEFDISPHFLAALIMLMELPQLDNCQTDSRSTDILTPFLHIYNPKLL